MLPEQLIDDHLRFLLDQSDPGDVISHLHVVSAPRGGLGPLGTVAETSLETAVYAIAPDGSVDAAEFTATTIVKAGADCLKQDRLVVFAAIAMECWKVELSPGAEAEELAKLLTRERRLQEHPDAVEMTHVYGVCRDGRRWRAQRYLTGPKAGSVGELETLVGAVRPGEAMGPANLLRKLVGLG